MSAAIVVAVTSHHVPGMASAIGGIEYRASEVEVVAVRIAGIHSEVPVAVSPGQRAVEVRGCTEVCPLPVQQHIAQVSVAALPVAAIHIVVARDTHQVVEVDFVGSLILLVGQVQLIRHLVRQEQCLVSCLLIAHGLARSGYRQHHQGYHYLLHRRIVFIGLTSRVNVSRCKIKNKNKQKKRISPKLVGGNPYHSEYISKL